MKPGDIVLAALPQADGTPKNRPAVFLCEMPPFRDLLVCGVSTQLHQQVPGFDDVLTPADPDFAATGFRAASVLRFGFLAVVPRMQVVGAIGTLSPARHRALLQRLSNHLLR